MTHASLFSGIGGFDLAAEWCGWNNVFWCEKDPFCQKILSYYWPKSTQYYDIKTTDFTVWREKIDVLSGGFPCQPFSTAGRRKGTEDDRYLWPEMLRAIREIRPTWVVGENVRGLVNWSKGMVFEQVQADLEAEGYEVIPFILPACSVDAPHRRDRIWFIAYSSKSGLEKGRRKSKRLEHRCEEYAFTDSRLFRQEVGQKQTMGTHKLCKKCTFTDTNNNGHSIESNPGAIGCEEREIEREKQWEEWNEKIGEWNGNDIGGIDGKRITSNANSHRLQRSISTNINKELQREGRDVEEYLSTLKSTLQFKNFPTQPPLCGGDDGLSSKLDGITFSKWRKESLKGYGNAVVPQLVYQIFDTINTISHDTRTSQTKTS